MTSLVGVPVLVLIFWMGGWLLTLLCTGLSLLAFREMGSLMDEKGIGHSRAWVLPYVLALPLLTGLGPWDFWQLFGLLSISWLLLLLGRELFSSRSEVLIGLGGAMTSGLIGTLPFASLLALVGHLERTGGPWQAVILILLACTWATDTFAYFGGRFLGKHKLFERVSPKKTIEGFVIGLAGSIAVGLLTGWLFDETLLWTGCLIGLVMGLLGPMGDLLESRLKRDAGVKDSAKLLPGHGGVLDRFDSWIFSVPVLHFLSKLDLLSVAGY